MKKHLTKFTVLCVFILISYQSNGQTTDTIRKVRHPIGFCFGLNYTILSDDPDVQNDNRPINRLGFRVGGLLNYNLSKNLVFSPKLVISFNKSKLYVDKALGNYKELAVSPATIELSGHMRYVFQSYSKKPHLVLGPNFKLPITDKSVPNYIDTKPDIAIDFGVGFTKINDYFTLLPELRYSYGLLDISNSDDFTDIGSLYMHNVTITLNFL